MKQTLSALKYLFFIVLSAGWILPLFLSLRSILSWGRAEVGPRLAGESPINSFPFLQFSSDMLGISLGWLALAIAVWTVFHLKRREQPTPA